MRHCLLVLLFVFSTLVNAQFTELAYTILPLWAKKNHLYKLSVKGDIFQQHKGDQYYESWATSWVYFFHANGSIKEVRMNSTAIFGRSFSCADLDLADSVLVSEKSSLFPHIRENKYQYQVPFVGYERYYKRTVEYKGEEYMHYYTFDDSGSLLFDAREKKGSHPFYVFETKAIRQYDSTFTTMEAMNFNYTHFCEWDRDHDTIAWQKIQADGNNLIFVSYTENWREENVSRDIYDTLRFVYNVSNKREYQRPVDYSKKKEYIKSRPRYYDFRDYITVLDSASFNVVRINKKNKNYFFMNDNPDFPEFPQFPQFGTERFFPAWPDSLTYIQKDERYSDVLTLFKTFKGKDYTVISGYFFTKDLDSSAANLCLYLVKDHTGLIRLKEEYSVNTKKWTRVEYEYQHGFLLCQKIYERKENVPLSRNATRKNYSLKSSIVVGDKYIHDQLKGLRKAGYWVETEFR
jgi:hypothetical protein